MKVALLINQENFKQYSRSWEESGWELIHMGNGAPDKDKLFATGADVLVVDAIMPIGADIIDNMPGLKMIHSQGVAYNGIDIAAAKARNIYVCNCAGVNARAVAEQGVLLVLALLKNFRQNEDTVYAGRQIEAKMRCFGNGIAELGGRSVGIVGYGSIGREFAARIKPFGCEIFYNNASGEKKNADAKFLPLDKLYAQCDIISLHAPVNPGTMNMINDETLGMMKPGAILINTARGELIDHAAVVRALVSGRLGGFGTDTLAPEPVLPDNPFLTALPEELRYKVALSPHIAGLTAGSFLRTYECVQKNLLAVEKGERPDNIVSGL